MLSRYGIRKQTRTLLQSAAGFLLFVRRAVAAGHTLALEMSLSGVAGGWRQRLVGKWQYQEAVCQCGVYARSAARQGRGRLRKGCRI